MIDGLDKLKDIGAQKIHEKTHISRQHVQAILHESFEGIQKIQLIGFISILEREYDIDLSDLRTKAIEYYGSVTSAGIPNNQVFVVPKKKKNFTVLYITIVLFIFIGVAVYSINSSSSTAKIQDNKLKELNNSAKLNTTIELIEDANSSSIDTNSSVVVQEEIEPEVIEVPKSLKIFPKVKVWIGWIDLETHKKHQSVVKNNLDINASKDWILVFGHGNIDIEVNGEVRAFKSPENLRFVYRDGNLTKIDYQEFKRLNKGNQW